MMDDRIARDDGKVLNVNMPAQKTAIAQDDVVEDVTVMSDVGIGHQEIAIPDPRDAVFLVGTAIDSDALAKEIIVADFHPCRRAAVSDVLRLASNGRARKKAIAFANPDVTDDGHMTVQLAIVAKSDMRSNDTKRPDFDSVTNSGSCIDLRKW